MIKKNFENNRYIFLATSITCIILLITYAFSGFFPFGENSILRVDLYHQYAPFHEELRQKILTGDSLFYSWQGGLGKEFLSQIAYYTVSPISFLILLFPSNYISEAILLFVFIKIALCSFCFSYYLKNSFNKNSIFITIFGVMYGFMAFITSFYWNIMWLDTIYLFPIVALGIDRLVKDGSYKTYLFSLLFCIIVNFYVAFFVCIFITLYFLIKLLSAYSIKTEFSIILNRCFKFFILSLLAGGATMFLAIPMVVALGRTQTSETTFPSFELYKNIYQIISAHFSGARPVVLARNEDLPNIYSGVLTMALLPTYFFNKEIKLKERISFLALILFMLGCAVFKQLDFIIHGMHFPANLPHRFTFIYSFIILILAYKTLININGVKPLIMYVSIGLYILFKLINEYYIVNVVEGISRVLSLGDIITNIILLILYTLIILYYKNSHSIKNIDKNKINKFSLIFSILFGVLSLITFLCFIIYNNFLNAKTSTPVIIYITILFVILAIVLFSRTLLYVISKLDYKFTLLVSMSCLLFIVSCESLFNSINGFEHNGGVNRNDYVKYIDNTKDMLQYIKDNDNDENKFYRQEFSRFSAINESTMYHYNGFSTFSSLAYGDTSQLMENLGIAATSNSYRYYDPTPIIDAMFNMKYIMSKDHKINNESYDFIKQFDNVYLYKNKKPLSVGFMVNNNIDKWKTNKETPFMVQNDFIKKSTGVKDNIFTEFPIEHFRAENVDIEKKLKHQSYSYTLEDEKNLDLIPTVYARAYIPKTERVFLYVESTNSKRFKYYLNGQEYDREISTGRSLIDLGILNAGDFVDIEFSLNRKGAYETKYSKTGKFRVYAATFDTQKFEEIYRDLEDEIFTVTEYDSTSLNGKIYAKKDGIMFTSIPYDDNFDAFVDGEKTELIPIGDKGLIGIKVQKGQHNISFKYNDRGFKKGLLLTIISLIGIVIYIFIDKKYKNKKQNS